MAKQSAFLLQQQRMRQVMIDATEAVMKQFMLDTLQCTLHDMGYGYDRVLEITKAWGEKYSTYYKALSQEDEADYLRFCLDREIQGILKGREFAPFESRYPDIKSIKYGKGK